MGIPFPKFARSHVYLFIFLVLIAPSAFSQATESPYLLRLVHENNEGVSCVLLQDSGEFHYETGDRYNTRVYEGEVPTERIMMVRRNLQPLSKLSQREIQEPLRQSGLAGGRRGRTHHVLDRPSP